jgi:hypothetical protein
VLAPNHERNREQHVDHDVLHAKVRGEVEGPTVPRAERHQARNQRGGRGIGH